MPTRGDYEAAYPRCPGTPGVRVAGKANHVDCYTVLKYERIANVWRCPKCKYHTEGYELGVQRRASAVAA